GLDLGSKIERALKDRVVKRFDSRAVASGEEELVLLVPYNKSELAAQLLQALRSLFFVKVQRDLAVGASSEPVAAFFQLLADFLEAVKLGVDDAVDGLVLVGDGLVASTKVDDAQARVPQGDLAAFGHPLLLRIRAPVLKRAHGLAQRLLGDS